MRVVLPMIHLDELVFTPLPQLRLKQALVKAGHDPTAITVVEYRRDDSLQAALDDILNYHPDVVGFSCYTWNFLAVERLSAAIKAHNPEVTVVWGGPHISECPERFATTAVDYVVLWYGEGILPELLQRIGEGQLPDQIATGMDGVFTQGQGRKTAEYPHIADLGYPYDYMPASVTDHIADRVFLIESYRNCPFSCFPGEVLISTTQGSNKPISEVQVGDKLVGYNEATGKLAETVVVETFEHKATELLRVYFSPDINNRSSVRCTPEHPFYVNGKWIEARNLKPGDEIYHLTGYQKTGLHKQLYNPVFSPETRAKISVTLKAQANELAERMRQTRHSGRWRPGTLSAEERKATSERMRLNNPMRRPEVAAKMAATLRGHIADGSVIPPMLQPDWVKRFQTINKSEQKLADFLQTNFPDSWQFVGTKADDPIGDWCRPDFIHISDRKVIEFMGCYWHNCSTCHPNKTPFPINKGRDHHKREVYKDAGYKLLEVWEHELVQPDILSRRIGAFTYNGVRVTRIISTPEKSTLWLRDKQNRPNPTLTSVYNLHCEPHNNYFAGGLLSHNCSYCLWGQAEKSYEALSSSVMVEQMYRMVDDGARIFMYADAGLGLIREEGKQRDLLVYERFARDRLLQRAKAQIRGYFFWQTMNDPLLDVLAELIDQGVMGQLDIGIQTFNEAILEDLQRPTNYDKFFATVERLHQRDIRFSLDLILGLPGDTLEGFKDSLRKVIRCRPNRTQSFPLSILPGTAYDLNRERLGIKTIRGSYRDDAETVIATKSMPYADMLQALDLESWMFLYYAEGLFSEGLNALAEATGRDELTVLQALRDWAADHAPALYSLVRVYREKLYDSRSDGRHLLEQQLMDRFTEVYKELFTWFSLVQRSPTSVMDTLRAELLAFPKTRTAAQALAGTDNISYRDNVLTQTMLDGTPLGTYRWRQDPVIGAIVRNRNFYTWVKGGEREAVDLSTSDDLLQGAKS